MFGSRRLSTAEGGYSSMPLQLGKGFREDSLNDRINLRTRERLSSRFVSNSFNAPASELYHSGGTSSASAHNELSGKFSILLSQGSKLCHPVMHLYTSLRPKTPRTGESGKLHSPALK